jgi:hypothetical protein
LGAPFWWIYSRAHASQNALIVANSLFAQEKIMNFDEKMEGDYRIYAGAVESLQGDGYIAALVINRVRGDKHSLREAFRDESLACGHRWESPDAALQYAVTKARELIHTEGARLAC